MESRLHKLRQKLEEKELDALLVSQPENRRYLSGFSGSAGFLLISQRSAILATDFRYVEQAKGQALDFEVVRIKGEVAGWLPQLASELDAKGLGFEADYISFASYRGLTEAMSKSQNRLLLIPTEGLVESLRAVKEVEELELIARAVELSDAALEHITGVLSPGMREKEAAWELERFIREGGSEPLPFHLIVASGPNSALPHAQPTDRVIGAGEPVLIDIGARFGGYSSDLSRTLCLGDPDTTFNRIYDIVLGAQLTALATLKAGMSGDLADHLGRTIIEEAGYGEAFGHGLGHGIGLASHEEPRLGPDSPSLLSEGMVFTVEPGIYLQGWGGVRVEDVVILGKEGGRALTKAPKIRRQR